MDITVFGANGSIGQLVVRGALDRGHAVTGFVHSRDPFPEHDRLTTVAGEVTDEALVESAVAGSAAVISTLGAFGRGTGPVLTPGMRTITAAMRRCGAERIVTMTGAALARPGGRTALRARVNRFILSRMDRQAVHDSEGHLEVLMGSGLNWTVLCAPTVKPDGSDAYRLDRRMPLLTGSVAGPGVAAALVDLAGQTDRSGEILGIHRR